MIFKKQPATFSGGLFCVGKGESGLQAGSVFQGEIFIYHIPKLLHIRDKGLPSAFFNGTDPFERAHDPGDGDGVDPKVMA